MKKTLLLIVPILAVSLIGCKEKEKPTNDNNTFVELANDETLFVGNNHFFRNTYNVDTQEVTSNYIVEHQYILYRTTYSSGAGSVYYNGYYYYWQVNDVEDTYLFGNRTTTTTTVYSYLKYGQDENIAVKATTTTVTTYDFESGFVSIPKTFYIQLNGYFTSVDNIETNCPDLYYQVDRNPTQRIYKSARETKTVNSNTNTYNTYFYIEKV